MTGLSETLLHPNAGTGVVIAVMGYLVVFFGIILLLAVVTVMGRVMIDRQKKAEPAAAPVSAAPAPAPAEKPKARGTGGELKLYNVSERDAALIMAIVAHKLGRPVNELRFRSIREVEEK